MEYFAGLDVSMEETSICVIDQEGKLVLETKAETDPDAIFEALKAYAGRLRRVGHEAGSFSPWLQVELLERGVPMVCLEAYHARAAMSAMRNKTDRTDAQGIAHIVRTGWFRQVHVKSEDSYRLRLLLTHRRNLKRKFLDIENAIRHSIKTFGLKLGSVSRGEFEARVRELTAHDPLIAGIADCMLRARTALWQEYLRLHKLVVAVVSKDEVLPALHGHPGRGADQCFGVQDFRRRSAPLSPLEDRRGLSRPNGPALAVGHIDRRFRAHLQGRRRRGTDIRFTRRPTSC